MIDTLFIAFIAVLIYFVLKYLTVWLLPFLIGFIFALALQRPVTLLSEKTKIPRGIWSFLLVFIISCLFFGLLGLIVFRVYSEAAGFANWITGHVPELKQEFSRLSGLFSGWLDRIPPELADAFKNAPVKLIETAASSLSSGVSSFAKFIIVNVPGILLTTVLSVISSCFITNDYQKITRFILCQFSPQNRLVIQKSKRLLIENVLKMFCGYLIIMTITFTELLLGFLLIGVKYAGIIAVLIAIADILPVLGTGTILVPWVLVEFVLGNGIMGLKLLALYVIITIIRNIIEPKIIGKQVGLSPIITLIAMYLGLKVFGFFGMFGLPILIIIIVKLQETGMIHIWKSPEQQINKSGR